MKKNIHSETKICTFSCATCGSKFNIDTTIKADTYGIDICSHCHPFYIGKTTNKQLRGKAEKMQPKFDIAKSNAAAKTTTKAKERKEPTDSRKSLDSL